MVILDLFNYALSNACFYRSECGGLTSKIWKEAAVMFLRTSFQHFNSRTHKG
jgi:hypothetical protein